MSTVLVSVGSLLTGDGLGSTSDDRSNDAGNSVFKVIICQLGLEARQVNRVLIYGVGEYNNRFTVFVDFGLQTVKLVRQSALHARHGLLYAGQAARQEGREVLRWSGSTRGVGCGSVRRARERVCPVGMILGSISPRGRPCRHHLIFLFSRRFHGRGVFPLLS